VKAEASGREIVRTVRYAMERRAAHRRALHAQRMEAIGQIAGGIAHDLNNLMTVIGVSLDTLAQARDPDEIGGLVAEAQGALTRGVALTRQILGLSRRQTLATSLVDVGAVVRGSVGLLRRVLGMVRVELVDGAALPPVRADATMLEQVMMNLAINARDAMRGHGTLTVRTRCVRLGADEARALHEHARSGEFVCVVFEDTGPGVDPAIQARVWDPFFTTRASEGGTGLGLTTVYGIARQHDGWVTLDSPPGRGASFELWLPSAPREVVAREAAQPRTPPRPVQASAAPPGAVGAGPVPAAVAPPARGRVLIVDDEYAILSVARRVLVAAGWEVECISDGATAIARVDAGFRPTVVLVDLTMPGGLGGVEVADALAERIPDVPVVFTSGFSDDVRLRGRPIIEGVNFLSKPFTADGLRRFVAGASGLASD
jgi:two-component system cell cycle sensor histidine kinase/response regulator CckA